MAELDLSFIDTNWADDLPLQTIKSTYDPVEVDDIRDFVNKVLQRVRPGDCIKTLTLYAHGRPGRASVGTGRHERPSGMKLMSPRNAAIWRRELRRLRCKFCQPDGQFRLNACGAGAELDGARLLRMIAQELVCAKAVAPLGTISMFTEEGFVEAEYQEVQGGSPPESVPLPPPKPSQLDETSSAQSWKSGGESYAVMIGTGLAKFSFVAPHRIVDARLIPADFDRPKSDRWLAARRSLPVSSRLLAGIQRSFVNSEVSWRAFDLLSIQAYLQLAVMTARGKKTWAPPGSLLGGCRYYCPFIYDSTFVYKLTPTVARALLGQVSRYYRQHSRGGVR
jgi:hypothetical protein